MKKSIIYFGIALLSISNIASANTFSESGNGIPIERLIANNTPLCQAIVKGDVEVVKKFIEYGADVNERSNGMTPLMLAARYNRVEIIKLLVDSGADVKAKNDKGFTALKYAELSNASDAVAFLNTSSKK